MMPRPSTRAFTAVELVVTLGVISILTAILVPSLAGARRSAHRTVCMSQLRSMTTGLRFYADEHDAMPVSSVIIGARPRSDAGDLSSLVRFELPTSLAEYLDAEAPSVSTIDGQLEIRSDSPWICPGERSRTLSTDSRGHPHQLDGFSYGYGLGGFGLNDRSLKGLYTLNPDPAAGRAGLRHLENNPSLPLLYDDQAFHADEPGLAPGATGKNIARFDGSVEAE